MGAGKPDLKPTEFKPPKPKSFAFVRLGAMLIALALPAIIYFAEPSEFPALAPHEETKLQERLREIDDSEQYALLAAKNGWYPTNNLLPKKRRGMEVWSYQQGQIRPVLRRLLCEVQRLVFRGVQRLVFGMFEARANQIVPLLPPAGEFSPASQRAFAPTTVQPDHAVGCRDNQPSVLL